jgi:hypothetical protein
MAAVLPLQLLEMMVRRQSFSAKEEVVPPLRRPNDQTLLDRHDEFESDFQEMLLSPHVEFPQRQLHFSSRKWVV